MWELFALDELAFIEESFNNDLLWAEWPGTREQGYYFEHDLSEIDALNEDSDSRMNRAVVGVQGGVLSINEAREIVEMDAINDPQADAVSMILEQQAKEQQAQQKADELAALKLQQPQQFQQQQPGQPVTQPPAQPAAQAESPATIPFFDFVGQTAILPDGSRGTIEVIRRDQKKVGEFGALKASAKNPVLIINGEFYSADSVRVVIDG